MNRKNLTSAVLAGLAGAAGIASTAQAVNLNPDGIGQVLVYPYYTVNKNADGNAHSTLMSVVNTTENAKAVKVRFNEGQNSQEVLDFNLYLSPYDVWTAAIINRGDVPTLFVNDTSCTVPYLYALNGAGSDDQEGQPFVPFALDDKGVPDEFDPIFPRGAEGHFEMIEMGVLTDEDKFSATAATHEIVEPGEVANPNDCEQLNDAWFDGATLRDNYWIDDPLTDIEPPAGGLFGGASIVNVKTGYMFSYDAKAINGWSDDVYELDGLTPLHQQPGSVLPSLDSGNQLEATVFLDNGDTLVSTGLTRSVDAVSFLFMHDQVMNEYTTGSGINSETEFVMTFPTKKWYTWDGLIGVGNDPLPPFTTLWEEDAVDTDGDGEGDAWGACEIVSLTGIFDREEQVPGSTPGVEIPPIVSPSPPDRPDDPVPVFELCYETSVIEFRGIAMEDPVDGEAQSSLLGSFNFHVVNNGLLGFENGWVRLQLDDYTDSTGAELSRDPLGGLEGLPITGFAANRFGNFKLGEGADVLANYGGIFQHKGTRKAASS